MSNVKNPKTFTIEDPTITSDNVTGMQIGFGKVSGVYTLTANVPPADISAAEGSATGNIADLNESLAPGTWFAAAFALNAGGVSAPSPEVEFDIVPPVPAAPTGFSVA